MKVSIIVPTYKRPDYLERLLTSLTKQTYQDFEVIVVDDHSDNLKEYREVIDCFQAKIESLSFFSNPENRGACFSRNVGISKAKYDILCFVDDDDEWLPEKLEKQLNVFTARGLDLCSTWARVVNDDRDLLDVSHAEVPSDIKKAILESCFICSPSVMAKKAKIVEAGCFDETFPSCQDWDMWTRMIFNGAKFDIVQEELVNYFKHEKASIGKSKKSKLGYLFYYKKHFSKLIKYYQVRHLYRYFVWSLNNSSS